MTRPRTLSFQPLSEGHVRTPLEFSCGGVGHIPRRQRLSLRENYFHEN
ncbi:hypothetical protein C4J97_4572 [Pseudomonas orientalis]|nr:hypothetical protein C4J97_4572 [Pseudomonas orientalis]